jgi:hypothetical protein
MPDMWQAFGLPNSLMEPDPHRCRQTEMQEWRRMVVAGSPRRRVQGLYAWDPWDPPPQRRSARTPGRAAHQLGRHGGHRSRCHSNGPVGAGPLSHHEARARHRRLQDPIATRSFAECPDCGQRVSAPVGSSLTELCDTSVRQDLLPTSHNCFVWHPIFRQLANPAQRSPASLAARESRGFSSPRVETAPAERAAH